MDSRSETRIGEKLLARTLQFGMTQILDFLFGPNGAKA